MNIYSIEFMNVDGHNKDGVNKNDLKVFPSIYEKAEENIDLNTFVHLLDEDGWVGIFDENAINNEYSQYRLYSRKYNAQLIIKVSNDIRYKHSVAVSINQGINRLNEMTGNIYINNFRQNTNGERKGSTNKDRQNLTSIKGTKYNPSIKKVLRKNKVKIALCTLGAAVTIVLGSVVVHSINVMADAQQVINDNSQYSYKNDQSTDYINNDRQLHQAIQNGQYDAVYANPNGQLERDKMAYNSENYQNIR